MNLTSVPVQELNPDKETINLFEMLLERAKKGEIKGGLVIAIDKQGEIDYYCGCRKPEKMQQILGAMEVTKHALLGKYRSE